MTSNSIFNEDCRDTMKRMDDDSVDMIITSPPYDDQREYNGYSFEFEPIAHELYRVIKPGGVIVWVVNDQTIGGSESGTSFRQALYFMEVGFKLWDTQIYYKNNPMPSGGKRYHQHFEYMFVFSKDEAGTFNPITEPTKYRGPANMKNRGKAGKREYTQVERTRIKKVGNVFSYNVGWGHTSTDKIAFEHPAIFPEKLVEDQVITWSNPGELVYDPFMGSGTTAKVAQRLNRNYLGSEISKGYCDIAAERLKQSTYTENQYF